MGGDDFCLKWNDHHSVFFNSVEKLCRGEILTDVTLSCGNGVDFYAHKLVLSVCSGYFSGLFSRNVDSLKNGNTIVYLKDVEPRHLELILSYMYRGEINVEESELVGLLSTAKGLQIKGLTDSNEEPTKSTPPPSKSRSKSEEPSHSKSNSKRKDQSRGTDESSSIVPNKRIKEECPLNPVDHVSMELNEEGANSEDRLDYPQTDPDAYEDKFHLPDEGGPYIHEADDSLSGAPGPLEALLFLSKSPSLATSRVTSTDTTASGVITCYYCLREFPTRWNLTRHMENAAHSGEKPFCCLVCNERFGQKADLKAHLQLSHNLAL